MGDPNHRVLGSRQALWLFLTVGSQKWPGEELISPNDWPLINLPHQQDSQKAKGSRHVLHPCHLARMASELPGHELCCECTKSGGLSCPGTGQDLAVHCLS
jgi:hypothetical protein